MSTILKLGETLRPSARVFLRKVRYFSNGRACAAAAEGQQGDTAKPNNFLLSSNYTCTEAWNKRLETPILKKVELEDFFYEVDRKYQAEKTISAVDVDLFVNKVTDEDNLDELEELVHRLRRSPATIEALPSTGHATIRSLLEHDRTDALMRILNDRMNYGVFLDYYLANLLMDTFLARENYRDAAKTASLLMLEQDFGPVTTQLFCILSGLKYLENPIPEPWDTETVPEEESKEEVKVRVRYQRNAFYDDHFELTIPRHIVGKTLAFLSLDFQGDAVIRNSIELLGYALHDKWDNVVDVLKRFISGKLSVSEEAVKKVTELVEARLAEVEASPDKTLPTPPMKKVPGRNLQDTAEIAEAFKKLGWHASAVEPLPLVKSILSESKLTTSKLNLISATKELLAKAVAEQEKSEVENMTQVYRSWDDLRVKELDKQVTRFREINTLLEIQQKKRELAQKEDTIFFFDNEEQWMMRQPAEAPPVLEAKDDLDAKGNKKKVKKVKEDDSNYISPDIKGQVK